MVILSLVADDSAGRQWLCCIDKSYTIQEVPFFVLMINWKSKDLMGSKIRWKPDHNQFRWNSLKEILFRNHKTILKASIDEVLRDDL